MKRLTLEIIGLAAYGIKFDGITSQATTETLKNIEIFLEDINKRVNRRIPFLTHTSKAVKQARYEIKKTILTILNKKLDNLEKGQVRDKPDLLDVLIEERQNNDITGQMSNDDIVSEARLFLIAGSETTSNTLSFLFLALAQFPDVQEKLYQEIMQIVGDKDIEYEDLSKFKYLQWTINEVMRFTPTVERTGRLLTEPVKLGPFTIPAGTNAIIDIRGMQLNEKLWDEPLEFRPERFDNWDKKNKSFSPFGGGKRICVGKSMAMIELQLTTIKVLRKFRLISHHGEWPVPIVIRFTTQPQDSAANIRLELR